MHQTRKAHIVEPMPVPAGTAIGDVILVGGLLCYVTTERVTQAQIDDFNVNVPQGLADGEASCELIDISITVRHAVAEATTVGARIYRRRDTGAYTIAADTGGTAPIANDPIGYTLEAKAAGEVNPIGLTKA